MGEEEKHYPGDAETEEPQETPEPETPPTPEEESEAIEPEEPEEKPEAPEPEADPKEPITNKKRSIYDDLKDKKKEAREFETRATTAEARVAELEGLLGAQEAAETPHDQAIADEELAAFAAENKLDAKQLDRMAAIFSKRSALPEDIKAALADIKELKAKDQRAAEDAEIRSKAPAIKAELSIHDDKELQSVMDEIIKLAHTKEFHDKEVEYVVWKNKDKLSKMVSPKRPSFESGDNRQDSEPDDDVEFDGRMTPEQASKAMTGIKSSGYSISRRRGA